MHRGMSNLIAYFGHMTVSFCIVYSTDLSHNSSLPDFTSECVGGRVAA